MSNAPAVYSISAGCIASHQAGADMGTSAAGTDGTEIQRRDPSGGRLPALVDVNGFNP